MNKNQEEDEDEFVLKKTSTSKQDNYPAWMRELNSKEKEFDDRLQRVQEKQKTLVVALNNFDQKKEDHEKLMRQLKLKKKHEQPQEETQKIDKKKYHQYFQDKALEKNYRIKALQVNTNLMISIIMFDEDPVVLIMKLRRVCKKWSYQLLDEYLWQSLCKTQLGDNFVQMNQQFYFDGYWKKSAQLFRQNWSKAKNFFDQYQKNPQDMKVGIIIRECIFALKFFQKIISISDHSLMCDNLYQYSSKMEYCVKSLTQSTHYIICEEARYLYLTLQGHHNFKNVKAQIEDDQLLLTKHMYNQEIRSYLEDSYYIPSNLHYTWIDDKDINLHGFLRDQQQDKASIMNFMSTSKSQFNICIYDRYDDTDPIYQYVLYLKFIEKDSRWFVNYQDEMINLRGQLLLGGYSSQKPDLNEVGTARFGMGDINISLRQNNAKKEFQFESFFCLGIKFSNRKGEPLIIGNHKNTLFLLIQQL